MATPITTDDLTGVVERYLFSEIVDVCYNSNVLFHRWNKAKKIHPQGGRFIEANLDTAQLPAGGWYSEYDELTMTPADTLKGLAFDWKECYTPLVASGKRLTQTDSPMAMFNYIKWLWRKAKTDLAEIIGAGIWSTATTDAERPDGLRDVLDNGAVATVYGGQTRAGFPNSALNAKVDAATAALTLAAFNAAFLNATEGGRAPTLTVSRKEQYGRIWALGQTNQEFQVPVGGIDQELLQAGWTNIFVNNVPWVIDSHVFDGPGAANSAIAILNEDYFDLFVSERADFYMEPFQTPINQDAVAAKVLWKGNVVCTAPLRQAVMTNVSA